MKQRIWKDGVVRGNDVLKVDIFLNHWIDIAIFEEIGRGCLRWFDNCGTNKI